MTTHILAKALPAEVVELTAEQMALSALRSEIDSIDDQILELFERRLAIAAQVGKAKDAPTGPHTKLRPDREQAVLARLTAKAVFRCMSMPRSTVRVPWMPPAPASARLLISASSMMHRPP